MAYTRTQWDRIQQSLPTEDRMTYEEYLESLNAQSDAGNTARIATRDADAAELASLNAQANTAVAEAQRLEAQADASAPNPKVVETKETVEIKSDPTPVEKLVGPSEFSKDGSLVEFKPITNGVRLAVFGLNPDTGKPYTDAESAALNGGYLFEGYKDLVGYRFDSKTGRLEVLNAAGGTTTTGARHQMNAKGNLLARPEFLPKGVGQDANGKYYQPGERMPGENTAQFIARLSQLGQGVFFENGKAIQYDAAGRFYTEGEAVPQGFGTTNNVPEMLSDGTMSSNVKNLSSFTNSGTGAPNNPYEPGTPQYEDFKERRSAYDLLFSEFKQYGLDSLVTPLKDLIMEGISPAEFTIRLRETDAYKKRFAANAQRVAKGLRALSEAEYIGTEDQYQDVMRRYGMPESYYTKGDLGIQSGFEKFLAGDVSAVELEDRIQTAQNRVVNSNPEVAKALKEFYPGISNGDILAYVLDPSNAIEQIKRKVTAAEIGGAAIQSGLQTGMTRAEELAAAGITKQQAQQGFQTVAEVAPRGGVLADIYKQSPYTQTTAEQEVFGLAGSVDAAKQRKKLTQLETAAFSGTAGTGAIARDRAGAF